jgi:hypothetical protein
VTEDVTIPAGTSSEKICFYTSGSVIDVNLSESNAVETRNLKKVKKSKKSKKSKQCKKAKKNPKSKKGKKEYEYFPCNTESQITVSSSASPSLEKI